MKARTIGYWVATGLVAFAFGMGGVTEIGHSPAMTVALTGLGYPVYVLTLLGVWKILGAVAVVAPRVPRLKEWAYAGMMFDLTGAAFSHASAGDGAGKIVTPLVLLAVVATSWALRPQSRVLGRVFAPGVSAADPHGEPAGAAA